MENTQMTQKLPRLYKVERYAFDFVLAESVDEAESAVTLLDLVFEGTVTEITEMSPKQDGYSWYPMDAKTEAWVEETCGEWLKRTAELRRQEKEKVFVRNAALAKLSEEERAVILEWALQAPKES